MRTVVRFAETLLTTVGGAAISGLVGQLLARRLDFDPTIATLFAVVGGLNGAFAGARRIHAWRTPGGWLAFVLDSSWALIGTTQGVLVNLYNTLRPGSEFSPAFSTRCDRHVFGRGFALRRHYATTLGNVVTNARLGRSTPIEERRDLIELHEDLHVWQQRWFGPIYPLTYLAVAVIGSIVGVVFALVSRERRRRGVRIGRLIETAAYYDNPFEIWAYRNQARWEQCGAMPVLKWGVLRWEPNHDV
jgi:hypothetical protein